MNMRRCFLSLLTALALAGLAQVAQQIEPAGAKMTTAAEKFVGTLTDEQKSKAMIDFDSKERFNWNFVPLQDKQKKSTRKGLPLEEMTAAQKEAALNLVRAGTSASGYTAATTIMSLEAILRELEKSGAMVRNPDWYFFSIFGTPSKNGKWGWRVEGHHLSLNLTVDGGKVIGATPYFFGANPANVKAGPREGLRTLPKAEDLALDLFNALDDEQKKAAHQPKQFPEIEQGKPAPNVGEPRGLMASKMNDSQRDLLLKLLQSYTARMPEDIGTHEMQQVKEAGFEKVHFAFAGEAKSGSPHTYRIQGPTFVVEFLNSQNDSAGNKANHIHSCWRNMQGDFGVPR